MDEWSIVNSEWSMVNGACLPQAGMLNDVLFILRFDVGEFRF